MKNTVEELRRYIQKVSITRNPLPEDSSLNDILINKGKAEVLTFLRPVEETETETPPEPILYHRPHEEPIESEEQSPEIIIPEPREEAKQNIGFPEAETRADNPPSLLKYNTYKRVPSEERITASKLEVVHEHKLLFKGAENHYYILGSLSFDLGSLPATLIVEEVISARKERTKIDLYEREAMRNFALQLSEIFSQNPETIESDLLLLTDLLEQFRENLIELGKQKIKNKRSHMPMTGQQQKECMEFLSKPNLIERIDKLIADIGVVGEENSRRLLFIIASTYKMATPLHGLIQGSSGSGKSHLINAVAQCFPPEDVLSMTRVTSKSFYHYTKDELVDKLILIQDYDGLDEEAQYAFREMQSAGNISSSTTYKDRYGNLTSAVKIVRSHFASLLATTKAEVYYDNMSRSVMVGVDEGEEQTKNIITYQNKKLAGIIDPAEEKKIKEFLQNCMRCIQPLEVVNKYADKIQLPAEAKMLRRLNSHYQAFVKQVTILNQHQRKKDERGRLIAQAEDLQTACDILFDAIMIKVDDLDSSLRQFFDKMKAFIKQQAKGKQDDYQFTQRDVRLQLNVSKSQCFRYMEDLEQLEYVQKTGGYANRGFKYKIVFWDEMKTVKDRLKNEINKQLEQLNEAA